MTRPLADKPGLAENAFTARLIERLQLRRDAQLYRQRRSISSAQQPELLSNGKPLLAFCSNDYLGLANHPEVIAAFKRGLDLYGAGSGASHLIAGHSEAHHALEAELAAFTNRSRALVFSSGYMANVGVLTALLGRQDQVFEDRLNHASLIDGGLYCGATFKRYPHLDMTRLDSLLSARSTGGLRVVVSDGVFSMDGDVAPLSELLDSAARHHAVVMLDDAHGMGCLGSTGAGLAQAVGELGIDTGEERLPILIGTFGKAFGTAGAFVAGSEALIESLIQFCRPYVYTTALPPAIAEATRCSLRLVQQDSWRRAHLQKLIAQFRDGCRQLGLRLTDSATPIQGLLIGNADAALRASAFLEQHGLLVTAIRPPTVPPGTARLRITFSAAHTQEHVEYLLQVLALLAPGLHSEES